MQGSGRVNSLELYAWLEYDAIERKHVDALTQEIEDAE